MNTYEAEMKAIECLKFFIKEQKQLPSLNSSDTLEKVLAKWVLYQRNISNDDPDFAQVESPWRTFMESVEFSSYFNDPVCIWKFNLDSLKFFVKENGKHPSPATKDFNERRLAIWAERNRYLLKQDATRKGIMKNDDIYKLWCAFEKS